jgi:heme-degrading monooxygenase HmoA
MISHHYASGNWVVISGKETDFIARWTEFLSWTKQNAAGLLSAQLIQDSEDRHHFISYSSWDTDEALQRWRSLPEFGSKLGACRALCQDFRGTDYRLAASV